MEIEGAPPFSRFAREGGAFDFLSIIKGPNTTKVIGQSRASSRSL